MWLVGLDYVKVEGLNKHLTDQAKNLPLFSLHKPRTLYPVDFLENIVHMVHACSPSMEGGNCCKLEGVKFEDLKWRHISGVHQFLLNNHHERGSG